MSRRGGYACHTESDACNETDAVAARCLRTTLVVMASPGRDPYAILGVSPDVSDDQLHAAYRRLVQFHHPDHNDGSVESARRFEEIQDAYARIRQLRGSSTSYSGPAGHAAADPDVEARLADLESELRRAQAARERASRAAAEAAANASRRPSDEELGYVTTDDSFAKILADARSELSDRLAEAREHPGGRRVAELIDELAAKLKGVD
jgi:curved DNA-binding protein CbpA